MKKIILLLIFLGIGSVLYFMVPTKKEADALTVPLEKPQKVDKKEIQEVEKPAPSKNQAIHPKRPLKKERTEKFSQVEKNEYFQKIRDTIKEQWKELEDCENEFDLNFGDLMEMDLNQILNYLSDPNNLDSFLEKISSFNMTTPSSAKMIKQLAEPISGHVDGNEILATVGYVKTCKPREKLDLLLILRNLKFKNQNTALATLSFFENENSTLTYPEIMIKQIWDLKPFLADYGLKESDFPEITQITREYNDFIRNSSRIFQNKSNEQPGRFNPAAQKADYDFAVKLQPKIKSLLKKIKKRFI